MSRFTVLVFACLFSGSLLAEDKAEEKRGSGQCQCKEDWQACTSRRFSKGDRSQCQEV